MRKEIKRDDLRHQMYNGDCTLFQTCQMSERLIHKALRVTPAMEAGVTDHVWSLEEIAGLAV